MIGADLVAGVLGPSGGAGAVLHQWGYLFTQDDFPNTVQVGHEIIFWRRICKDRNEVRTWI